MQHRNNSSNKQQAKAASSSNLEARTPEFTVKAGDGYDVGSRREVNGAAVAGGIAGALIGGPVVGVAAAVGAAFMAASKKGEVADFARKSGTAMSQVGDKIQQVEKENKILDRTAKEMVKGASWLEKRLSSAQRKSSRQTQADLVS